MNTLPQEFQDLLSAYGLTYTEVSHEVRERTGITGYIESPDLLSLERIEKIQRLWAWSQGH